MKHAILIQVHKNPPQVARLCSALRHPDFDIFVSVDKKSDLEAFRRVLPDVYFIRNRVNVRWACFSQVQATLNAMEEIISYPQIYGHILFISGQDYPLVPMESIAGVLGSDPDKIYIDCRDAGQDTTFYADVRRRYQMRKYPLRPVLFMRVINKIANTILPVRKPPHKMYYGSNWLNITSAGVKHVLDYCRLNPGIVDFYRICDYPDELFFQSVLMQSPLAGRIKSNDFRYVDWSQMKPNPKILTYEDFDRIVSSDAWFARKFDTDIDGAILDMLDDNRFSRNNPAA